MPPSIFNSIVNAVSEELQIPAAALLESRRREAQAHARQLAMWLLRRTAPRPSYTAIGTAFAREHGTVIYGVRAVEDRLSIYPAFRARVRNLCQALNLPEPRPVEVSVGISSPNSSWI